MPTTATAAYQVADDSLLPGASGLDVRAPRFFVQMGFGEVRVDTDSIQYRGEDGLMVHRILPRGRIVPCVTFAQKTNIFEIREGEMIPNSEETDREGRTQYGKYWRPAWYEAERLLTIEAGTSRKSGLTEITALYGLASAVYGKNGSINSIFYPNGLDSLPERNADLMAYLEERVAELKKKKPAGVEDLHYATVLAVGDQLLNAAYKANGILRTRLEFTHMCMRLPPSEDLFKHEYDQVDEEMLVRTGIPRIHDTNVMTAEALTKLADGKSGQSDVDLLRQEMADLKITLKKRDEQIDALIGKITGAPVEVVEPKAKK